MSCPCCEKIGPLPEKTPEQITFEARAAAIRAFASLTPEQQTELAKMLQNVAEPKKAVHPCKPKTYSGCGNPSCQWCLQYNWSDPGR